MEFYGLISGLPVLKPAQVPPFSIPELKQLVNQYILTKDEAIIKHFYYQIDLINYNSLIQDKPFCLEGGNFSNEDLSEWFKTGTTNGNTFSQLNIQGELSEKPSIQKLQEYWQLFYDELFKVSNHDFFELIQFEISLKNFFKGHLERIIKQEPGIHFIEGGNFDRFAYNKLQIGDIQAEHPFLAAVLSAFDIENPFEREIKILEQKWKFYDYNTFFEPFGIKALFCWLLKFLDLHKWQLNNKEQGEKLLNEFEGNLLEKTQTKFT